MGSGFKTFTVGEVLAAADVQGYLMEQSVMVFASAAGRDSLVTAPEEGMCAYLQDVDKITVYDGTQWVEIMALGAWDTYTADWTASGTNPAIGNGSISGRFTRSGRTVRVYGEIVGGSTTNWGSGQYSISLPITAATVPNQTLDLRIFDDSTSNGYSGKMTISLADSGSLTVQSANADLDAVDSATPVTFTTSDTIRWYGTYEAAASA